MPNHIAQVREIFRTLGWDLQTKDNDKCLKFIWSLSNQGIQDKLQQKIGMMTLNRNDDPEQDAGPCQDDVAQQSHKNNGNSCRNHGYGKHRRESEAQMEEIPAQCTAPLALMGRV